MVLRPIAIVIAASLLAASARAQCPDGTQEPCRTARALPPLDDRTWIVLPFSNVALPAAESWLGVTAVKLLYFDMSRWTELRVIDDSRVTDLLRGIPAAEQAELGLSRALEMAKRVGAGNLVMGDFIREGSRTTITAKVFSVRRCPDGRDCRVRTVTRQVTGTDSLTQIFAAMVPEVLAIRAPLGVRLSGVGTSSLAALRAFALGMLASSRGRSDSAGPLFARAVEIDSTFALAHLWLGLSQQYTPSGQRENVPQALGAGAFAAAARHSASLPARERLIIAARRPGLDSAAICGLARNLLALDPDDPEGWLATGRCRRPPEGRIVGDVRSAPATTVRFNDAERALKRALGALQVDRFDAFQQLMVLYNTRAATTCAIVVTGECPPDQTYSGLMMIIADSIVTHIERVDRFNAPVRRKEFAGPRRALAAAASDLAALWTAANPRAVLGRFHYAVWQLRLGNLAGAARELDAIGEYATVANNNRNLWYAYRVELELRREQSGRVSALIDSAMPNGNVMPFASVAGQFSRDVPDADTTPARRATRAPFLAAYAGVVAPTYPNAMAAYAAARPNDRLAIIEAGTLLAFHTLKTRPPADTASAFSLFRFQAHWARGDTAAARRALVEYDAWGDAGAEDFFDAHEMFSAESHLAFGDTATAWTRIEPFGRRWPGYSLNGSGFWGPALTTDVTAATRVTGRAWLLYADLAMATGHADEARRGYRMIAGLWENGDAPVQPLVRRAKEALAKLGG